MARTLLFAKASWHSTNWCTNWRVWIFLFILRARRYLRYVKISVSLLNDESKCKFGEKDEG